MTVTLTGRPFTKRKTNYTVFPYFELTVHAQWKNNGKGISCNLMLWQNTFVGMLRMFAVCMGHNFVIKALFLCTMH